MLILDRYIIWRFLANFAILFAMLFVFAITIDLILQLDEFVNAVRRIAGDDSGMMGTTLQFLQLVGDFYGPRVFQFYAYLMGMVCIGAMAFTLAQMNKNRELVAVMASGMSLHRLAMPFLLVATLLNGVQLLNQELILPQLAPKLIRKHNDVGRQSINAFAVNFTRDSAGTLFHAARFDPADKSLSRVTLHERNAQGQTIRRIEADEAHWDAARGGWRLVNGRAIEPQRLPEDGVGTGTVASATLIGTPVDFYPTTLTPEVLTMRQYRQYVSMLGLRQIEQMLRTPGMTDVPELARHKFSRFASILINLMVLYIALPFFLLREPANLVRQSLLCAAVVIPILLGSLIGMTMDIGGIGPAVGVFLPPIVLVPVVLARFTSIRT